MAAEAGTNLCGVTQPVVVCVDTAATARDILAKVPTPDNAVMITIFFKHDQTRPLNELNAQLERQGFYKAFPPLGMEVVSWYVEMGIGQVVTLRLPAGAYSLMAQVNLTNTMGADAMGGCQLANDGVRVYGGGLVDLTATGESGSSKDLTMTTVAVLSA